MHLVHPPKFCITIVFNFSWVLWSSQEKLKTMVREWLGGQQGALWSMWKKWISSRIIIILLATKKCFVTNVERTSLAQDVFRFWSIVSQPRWGYAGEIQNTPFMKWNTRSRVQQSTKNTQWTVDRLADWTTSDQSNQSPGQQVSS